MPESDRYLYQGMILRIAIPSPLRRLFDYLPETERDPGTDYQPGQRVLVSFGRRKLVGVILEIANGSELQADRLKPVDRLLDAEPVFSQGLFRMLRWAINYYQHPPGEVLSTALPVKLRQAASVQQLIEIWQVDRTASAEADALLQRAPRQKALFDWLQQHGPAAPDNIVAAGFTRALLRQLQEKGLIQALQQTLSNKPWKTGDCVRQSEIRLNDHQLDALEKINADDQGFSCFLLEGVTGSGKTEVYMQAMAQVLKQGRQCLVLVPEIGLTPQTISRFEKRFKCPVVNLHSGLSDTERLQAWRQAHAGTAGIVIGTRSAVFTSLARPGLIVIDEEHDASFKQQDGFRYSARDLAVVRAREEGIGIVLGSATPSLESLYNADRGRYQHLLMPQRSGSAATAPMRLVDIENQPLEAGFSETALLTMDKHLQAGNQVLVFINRRGYAPVLHCQQCGWTAECDNCVAQLTVHAQPPGLHCHHCGKQESLPRACPNCASRQLDTMGLGTQQIESRLCERFTTVPVLRIDRDSTRSRKKLQAMLDQVNSGKPCLLLGTQMLAKGHHFPGITLVVIVDADSGLFSADFRGQELMAQTVTQVAGRAGRSDQAGEVLIQSRHCGHQTLQSLIQLSYADFSRQLLAERKLTAMPPFAWLALLRCEARSAETGLQFLQQIALQQQQLCQQFGLGIDCLGPLPAPMEKRAGRFRSQLSFKSEQRAQLHELLARLLPTIEAMKLPAGLRWSLDIDPVDMI